MRNSTATLSSVSLLAKHIQNSMLTAYVNPCYESQRTIRFKISVNKNWECVTNHHRVYVFKFNALCSVAC